MVVVVDNLLVSVLFGTYLIDRNIKGIFQKERKIVPIHSSDVLILSRETKPVTNME